MPDSSSNIGIQEKIAAKVLRTIVPIAVIGATIAVIAEALVPGQRMRALPDLAGAIFLILVWWVVYKEKFRLAAHMLTLAMCVAIIVGMTLYGGALAPVYMLTLIAVAFIALLYGPRYSLFFAFAFTIIGIIFLYLDSNGLLHARQPPPPWLIWIFISIDCFIVLGVITIPIRILHEALGESEERRVKAEEAYQLKDLALQALATSQEEVRESELRFRTLIKLAPIPLANFSIEGTPTYFNDRFVQLFGYTKEDIPTLDDWFRLAYPDINYRNWVMNTWTDLVSKSIREGTDTETMAYNVTCKDGAERIVEISGITMEKSFLATFVDITEKKHVEEELRHSEERLRAILDATPFPVALVDIDDINIVYWSRSAITFFGHTADTTPEWYQLAYPDPEYRKDVIKRWKSILENAKISDKPVNAGIYNVTCSDGSVRTCELYAKFLEDYLIVTFNDITERKKAAEDLQHSYDFITNVVNAIGDAVFVKDEMHKYVLVNNAEGELVGCSYKDMLGKSDTDFFPFEQVDVFWEMDEQVLETGQDNINEESLTNPLTRETRSIITRKARYIDQNGKRFIVGISRDITDRKQAEKALRASEERFRIAVSCTSDFIYERDMSTGEAEFFGEIEACLGFAPGEFPRTLHGWMEHIHPEDFATVLETIQKASENDGRYVVEYRLKRKNGTYADWLDRGVILRDEEGNPTKCIGGARDITERKQAENALRISSERYRDLVENSQDLICTHDLEGNLLSVNETSAKVSGYPVQKLLGMNIADALAPAGLAGFQNYLNTIRNEGKASGVVIVRTASGETRYWEYNNTLRTLGVDVPIVRGMAHDITERRIAEEEREKLEEQLRQSQKMEAVGNLAGGVAHEFNNLLQIILGLVEMVQLDIKADSENGALLEDVHKAGKRAAGLTQQLLAFSRRQTLMPTNLNLNTLIQDELNILRRLIEANIELKFIPGADMGTVRADRRQVEVILMNLCVNARDAMPKGGTLTIDTGNVVLDETYCQKHEGGKEGHYVRISVTDTGIGMDEDHRTRIFEPFYTTKGVGKGTGLGLSTVYGIVMQHQGMIDCYSEPGKGTAFNIYLPIVEEAAEELKKRKRISGPGGTETILIADDEEMLLKLLERMLTRAGYNVLKAHDGEEALHVFAENADEIDLVLLDVIMPKLSGQEVMERIKATSPHMRFLFSSGYSENAIQTNFIIKEGLRLVNKPYDNANLLSTVRETLDAEQQELA